MKETLNNIFYSRFISVIYTDENLNVLETNRQAKKILNTNSVLITQNGKISTSSASEMQCLKQTVKAVYQTKKHDTIFINWSKSNMPLRVDIYPVIIECNVQNKLGSSVVLIMDDFNRSKDFYECKFKNYFGLAKSEISLVSSLYSGRTLNEYADSKNVKISTARWTLANVFSKVGTNS